MMTRTEGNSRRRSMVISVLSGVTLLLLALTVFAVASQARSLSNQAERSVQTVENLRVVSLARAEISIASRIGDSSPEQLAVISGALENADVALDAVEANLNDQTTPETEAAFVDFRSAVDAQAEVLSDPDQTAEARRDAEVATGESFTVLGDILRSEQVSARDDLVEDNDLMNLIATISTFIVAFVVPSAALFVFQTLRSAPRELRKLRFEHDRLTRRSQAMAAAVSRESVELRTAISDNPSEISRSLVTRQLDRFEHIAVTNGAPTSLQTAKLDINDTLAEVLDTLNAERAVEVIKATSPITYTDSKHLRTIATELISNAVEHGEAPRRVGTVPIPNGMEIRVSDAGRGLPEAIVAAIVSEEDFSLREEARDGRFGYGLIAARQSLEALGGELRYERQDGVSTFIASIPAALTQDSVPSQGLQQAA